MAEEQIDLARRLDAIGSIAGGFAHDFKNHLTVALGYIEMAQIECSGSEKAKAYLEKATTALKRSKNLTQQMLLLSRIGVPNKTPVDLGRVLKNSVAIALGESGIRPQFVIADDLRQADADEGQIVQVIGHLVANAVQAMSPGGTIEVTASNATVAPGETPELSAGNYLKISVADHGCGIPDDNLPKVFEPFFSTKDGCSGLGLSTSFSIVKNHGGAIEARSKEGSGTTITFFLPALPMTAQPSGTAAASAS